MSLPASQSGFTFGRRRRASSIASHTSHSDPRLIPNPGSSEYLGDGGSEMNYGSVRGRPDNQVSAINAPPASSSHREPTRSSVHLSYRGGPPRMFSTILQLLVANFVLAHVDNTFTARSVREDTAELANYALSDRASARSVSPPRQRQAQTSLESYFPRADEDISPARNGEGLHHHIIQEVSEPVSPESKPSSLKGPGASALTDMLKRSPPNTPPKSGDEDGEEAEERDTSSGEESPRQRRLENASNDAGAEPTERTSLLRKEPRYETHHPDWIRGEQDIEGQETKRGPAWPKLRNVVMWPREKGMEVARIMVDPKAWDKKAIFQHAVKEPIAAIPAVILGTLLNILDALSYGMLESIPAVAHSED